MDLEAILAIIERIGSASTPSATELKLARTELARAIHSEARSEAPDLAVLTTLRGAFSQAGTALAEAEAFAVAQAAEVAELLADVEDPDFSDTSDDGDADADAEGEEDPDAEQAEDAAKEPVSAAAAPQAPLREPVRTMSLRDAAARVRVRPPAPVDNPTSPTANIFVAGVQVDRVPTLREMAASFERAVRSPSTGKESLIRFDTIMEEGRILPGDSAGNTRVLDSLVGPEAVAAAGGCCSLPTPLREQNVLSSMAQPLRDSLPAIGVAESGALTYFPAVCLPTDGVAEWLCSDDSAVDPDDPDTWKECVFIECPTAETTIVDAIYRCLTIGEFQRRFATEQWMAILQATLALQSRVSELSIWSKMLAGVSTTHSVTTTGSILTTWASGVQRAADAIRDDQRYAGVGIRTWLPRWAKGAIALDLYNRRIADTPNPTTVDAFINEVAANAGVTVTYTMDSDPIEPDGQEDGALTDYPSTFAAIVAPEGYYSFLDGGQFDLGIEIRDLDLARQNAVAAFAEGFQGVLARGCNAKRLNIPVDLCETAAGCEV